VRKRDDNINSKIEMEDPLPGIRLLTLNRPERLNALTFEMFSDLEIAARSVHNDPSIRVVVVTGAGSAFCAGLDLDCAESLPRMSVAEMTRGQQLWSRAIIALREIDAPVIAAVNGAAAGAGFSLALAADIRLASESAKFNAAFVRIGLSGGDCGSSWALPRIVGLGRAYEILLTGRFVDATEAMRIGLVNEVLAQAEIVPGALRLAESIAANSPLGVRLTKRVLQANVDAASLGVAVEFENRNQVLAAHTEDMTEALAAFREKRAPHFIDR